MTALFVCFRESTTNRKSVGFNILIQQWCGSGWVPVGSSDFKSVGVRPSVCAEGSTPLHSRQRHRKM